MVQWYKPVVSATLDTEADGLLSLRPAWAKVVRSFLRGNKNSRNGMKQKWWHTCLTSTRACVQSPVQGGKGMDRKGEGGEDQLTYFTQTLLCKPQWNCVTSIIM
jgi:hypothetical protein